MRVLGVRTAVERETIPYEQFLAEYKPNFPIFSDATSGAYPTTRSARP